MDQLFLQIDFRGLAASLKPEMLQEDLHSCCLLVGSDTVIL